MLQASNVKPRKKKQIFSAQFKEQVVKTTLSSPDSYAEFGRKYGVTTHQVARWCREYEASDARWVKQLQLFSDSGNQAEDITAPIQPIISDVQVPETAHECSESKQVSFSVDLSLPSGAKIHISNIPPDLLRTVLEVCR